MTTIGKGILQDTVFRFFDALRSYDVAKAAAPLADDADWEDPWTGKVTGKAAIEARLKAWLADPKTRPSLTIMDITGDGAITRLKVSVSGRFGQRPQPVWMDILCLKGVIHQVKMQPVA
ncbi:MAG TPA: nuclear transport factor 2 family protein [Candidatus Thermoplasmatota archaeon]|nr:nuclear transport factor 2 family protein [Candidatus Thermoplasmatota archaeon]